MYDNKIKFKCRGGENARERFKAMTNRLTTTTTTVTLIKMQKCMSLIYLWKVRNVCDNKNLVLYVGCKLRIDTLRNTDGWMDVS